MDAPFLTPEQAAEANHLFQFVRRRRGRVASDREGLASKPDDKLLGKTEFEVRDRVHTIGAKAIETALNERKKGGTKGPA